MVLFRDARSFLQTSSNSREAKSRLLDFFGRFKRGDYYLHPAGFSPAECFKSTGLKLRLIFLFRLIHKPDGPYEESVCVTFDTGPPDMGDVFELVQSFRSYQTKNLNVIDEMTLIEDVLSTRADTSAVFLLCQDHEGVIGIAAYPNGMQTDTGIILLCSGLLSRYPNFFPPSSGDSPA